MLFSKQGNVPEDLFAAVDLCLLICHLLVQVIMKSCRSYVSADFSDPGLEGVLVIGVGRPCSDSGLDDSVAKFEFLGWLWVFLVGGEGLFEQVLHLDEDLFGEICVVFSSFFGGRLSLVPMAAFPEPALNRAQLKAIPFHLGIF